MTLKHNLGNKPTLKVFPLPIPEGKGIIHILNEYEDFIRRTFEHDEAIKDELEHLKQKLVKENGFIDGNQTYIRIDEVLGVKEK